VCITIRTDGMNTGELKSVTGCRGMLVKFWTVIEFNIQTHSDPVIRLRSDNPRMKERFYSIV